ncbi:pectinesterase family protein [Streptomyces adelaidensis]|uniref:pectinesterase family protein n=1 Tax=Streptomyces adelaidensis TaxID=2796465 RepID=UPI001903D871|nr:pectinesterase family protein [Streptomyces adelaidensis]
MTTETQGQLPRRSFLARAIAVAAGAAMAGGTVLASAPVASAEDKGPNATWRISGDPKTDARGYANMLKAIKDAVTAGSLLAAPDPNMPGSSASPVNVTRIDGTGTYVILDIYSFGDEVIRVFLRHSDLYFMGYRAGTESGGAVTWRTFFTLEPAAQEGGASPLTDITAQSTDTRFNGMASYVELGNRGASRTNMGISPFSLENAVRTLGGTAVPSISAAAPAILQIIVGVAEAGRFRAQARDTHRAFAAGVAFGLTATHMAFHNNWGNLSRVFLVAVLAGAVALEAPIVIAGITIGTAAAVSTWLMTVHHSNLFTKDMKKNLEGALMYVDPQGTGDFWTIQEAINAAPDYGANTILIEKGDYHEVLSVPTNKSWLTITGITGNRGDVYIHNTRCNGMINSATGTKWGTQGSAVATFRAPNLTVRHLTINNTFDRNAHQEISPYETQAVAVVAMGDRQVYENVAIWSHQDTLYVKGQTPTSQARQYFVNCHIRGDVDFIFGNATAVIDRSTVQALSWPNGTVLAPNTDLSKKYGILLSSCTISTSGVANDTMHLGRPWNNTEDAWPQAIVRSCEIQAGVADAQPWVDMLPDQPWRLFGRFREYHNFGPGAGFGENSPQLTDAEAAEYTAQKYLAGTDGWNPLD